MSFNEAGIPCFFDSLKDIVYGMNNEMHNMQPSCSKFNLMVQKGIRQFINSSDYCGILSFFYFSSCIVCLLFVVCVLFFFCFSCCFFLRFRLNVVLNWALLYIKCIVRHSQTVQKIYCLNFNNGRKHNKIIYGLHTLENVLPSVCFVSK